MRALALAAALALLPGCGTIVNQLDEDRPFGGVRNDAIVMVLPFTEREHFHAEDLSVVPLFLVGGLIDLPFSLVGDVVMLPVDVAGKVR